MQRLPYAIKIFKIKDEKGGTQKKRGKRWKLRKRKKVKSGYTIVGKTGKVKQKLFVMKLRHGHGKAFKLYWNIIHVNFILLPLFLESVWLCEQRGVGGVQEDHQQEGDGGHDAPRLPLQGRHHGWYHRCRSVQELIMRLKNGPTETPECWSLKFQTEAIFADNFPKFADNLDI